MVNDRKYSRKTEYQDVPTKLPLIIPILSVSYNCCRYTSLLLCEMFSVMHSVHLQQSATPHAFHVKPYLHSFRRHLKIHHFN